MKRLAASLALATGALFCAAPASAAITVSFTPSAQHINVGDTVSVDVSISGLGAEILSAYDVNVYFNNVVLGGGQSITQYLLPFGGGANFGGSAAFNATNNEAIGYSLLDDATLAASQDDSFVFLSFSWTGLVDGVSQLSFGLDPDFERNLVGLDFATLAVDFGTACVAVGTGSCDDRNDVPEPASFGLAGVALLAGGLAGRRRRRDRVTA